MPVREDAYDRCQRFLVRHRTRLHAVAYLVLLLLARPNDKQDVPTLLFLVAGVALRIWAVGCVSKDRTLCTWGPYRYTRNPLYLANLLIGIGLVILANHWVATLACIVPLGVAYWATINVEEHRLRDLFGQTYSDYSRVTPRLLPCLRPHVGRYPGAGFTWRRALRTGLIVQTVAIVVLVCGVEAKEEYLEWRGATIPMTFGVAPVDLAPDVDVPELVGVER